MRSGRDDVSAEQVSKTRNSLAGETMRMGANLNAIIPPLYRISPVEMDMKMHMFGMMNGGGPEVGRFTGKTSGFGDAKLSAMIKLKDEENYRVHYTQ